MDNAVRFLQQHDDFTLIAHISPDGDTLGSSLALFHGLTRLGKRAQVVCADEVPPLYRFCPHAEQVLPPARARQTAAAVAVDCADRLRTARAPRCLSARPIRSTSTITARTPALPR